MAYTTIDDPSQYFDILLRSGVYASSGTHDLTGLNFQPDFVWEKVRSVAGSHYLQNSSLTGNKMLNSDTNNAENTNGNINSYLSNGIRIEKNSDWNSSRTLVDWFWKANGGTTTSFTESGSNPGGTHQANTTAGFSIVTYTGTGSAGTVQHGLSAVPQLIIIKDRGDASSWLVYTEPTGNTHTLFLNRDVAKEDDATLYNDTTPTSSVFSLGAHNDVNANDDNYVAYCFAEIKGYSKIGSYTGNGNADGPFVYTGFKPAWVFIKITNTTNNWILFDNKRSNVSGANVNGNMLRPNLSDAELTDDDLDFTSNGFKFRRSTAGFNGDGNSYIYMAFAEHPFVSSQGVPVTAR